MLKNVKKNVSNINNITYPTTYLLSKQVYYDTCLQTYYNIIIINFIPKGPLSRFVRRIQISPLDVNTPGRTNIGRIGCKFAIISFQSCYPHLMSEDELPDLIAFLLSNGYSIDTNLTNMINKENIQFANSTPISFITYNRKN